MDQESGTPREITPGATFAPVPAWVALEPYARPQTPNPHFISGGLCVLLDESQVDLCGPDRAWFYRRADMVTATVGAERVAQFSVSFDHRYERLEVHSVRVLRGDQVIDHTGAPGFESFRREQQMERLIFDGRQTIAYTIPDVRPGDVVETAYTHYGTRKSLGGRHSAWIPFEWSVGIVEVRVRQRAPKARAIAERGYNNPPQADERIDGDIVERRWRTFERPSFKYESLAPPWVLQSASLQLSEWRDWAEVAETFMPLYEDAAPMPGEVEEEIARIAAAEKTPAGRAAAVLRFTQNAVRYLAISMGEGGYTPRGLDEICSTRYGDCKDKSKLYTAMARKLGLDACPALVNTRDGVIINECLPSGQLFDHCIVRVVVDGKVHWLDPTRQMQDAPLGKLSECHFGYALPLCPGVAALERMPDEPHAHTLHSSEVVTLGETPTTPARYEWRLIHRNWRAEDLRGRIAREGIVGLFKLYADDIARSFPHARPLTQEVLKDDIADNSMTTLEEYEIGEPWAQQQDGRVAFATLDLFMRPMLARLDAGPRKNEIYLGHVGKVSRRVEINTKVRWPVKSYTRLIKGTGITLETALKDISANKIEMTQTLDITSWTMPAGEAQTYRDITAELERSDLALSSAVKNGKFEDNRRNSDSTAANVLRIAVLVALAAYWVWRFTVAPSAP